MPGVSLWNLGYGVVPAIGACVIAGTLLALWCAAVTDPGILPRWPRFFLLSLALLYVAVTDPERERERERERESL